MSTETDEKGRPLVTPVTETAVCRWCRTAFGVRAMGRRPSYCSPVCRQRHHTARRRVDRAYAELLAAQEALAQGGSGD